MSPNVYLSLNKDFLSIITGNILSSCSNVMLHLVTLHLVHMVANEKPTWHQNGERLGVILKI